MKLSIYFTLLCSVSALAQNSDYYVNLNGDTTQGEISISKSDWSSFTFTSGGIRNKLSATQVSQFYIAATGRKYVAVDSRFGRLFFQHDIVGFVSLSTTRYQRRKIFRLIDQEDSEVFVADKSGDLSPQEFIRTMGLLKQLFNECTTVPESDIENLFTLNRDLRASQLYKLINSYNVCKDPGYKRVEPKFKRLVYHAGLFVGMSSATLTDEGGNTFFTRSGISGSKDEAISFGGRLNGISTSGRSQLFVELSYVSHSFTSSASESGGTPGFMYVDTYKSGVKVWFLEFGAGFQYNIKVGRIRLSPFIGGTVRTGHVDGTFVSFVKEYEDGTQVTFNQMPIQKSYWRTGYKYGLQVAYIATPRLTYFIDFNKRSPYGFYFYRSNTSGNLSSGPSSLPLSFEIDYWNANFGLTLKLKNK